MNNWLTFDFETRSASPLKLEGAYKYSLDPTTQPTCLAVKLHGQTVVKLMKFREINTPWEDLPIAFRLFWQDLIHFKYLFVAHNAFFERCIYENILVKRYGWPHIPFRQYRCTAAKAAACALPRNLEGAGEAMALTIQKDKRGYNAMMATCKPTKQYNAWMKATAEIKAGKKVGAKKKDLASKPCPKMFLEYADNPDTWETLYTYCKIDVCAEEKLNESLPDLIPIEQEIWFLNQELNWRGLYVDIPLVKKIITIMEAESKMKLEELDTLTMGLVTKPGARKSILEFLALEDIILPDIRAKTVDDVLAGGNLSEDMRRLLEIRKALSKTSTRKYQSIEHRAGKDNRVRDILLYHGASTGRLTGTGIQPHNFPRGLIKVAKDRPYAPVENVKECDADMLRILYGESLAVLFSSILRNMLMPSPGHSLFVADFSKIEVAVLWWLSDNKPGLKILKAGLDPYKYMAAANSNKPYASISDDGDERQLGKAQVLGCGFGMGWVKFQTTAFDMYRLKLTAQQSRDAVSTYREANEAVPALWKEYERAAIIAIKEGIKIKAGKCLFFVKDKFLWVQLPSGRRLAYRDPQISWRESDWGPKETVEFFAVNSKTKKWALERSWGGTFTENIVQAVAADLMNQATLRLEKANYKVLLSVHDEILTEKVRGSVKEFTTIMCERPDWADSNLVIEAKAWEGPRYRK